LASAKFRCRLAARAAIRLFAHLRSRQRCNHTRTATDRNTAIPKASKAITEKLSVLGNGMSGFSDVIGE
jgi:hypothetical protein